MATEYVRLTRALRAVLKEKGLRYRQVAEGLGVAESTIKRVLTAKDGSVGRLAEICEAAGVGFAQVVAWAHEQETPHWLLSPEQEAYFLEDPEAFRIFEDLSMRKRTLDEVRTRRGLERPRLRRVLERLESLELIEVTGRRQVRIVPRGAISFPAGSRLLAALRRDLATRLVARLCAGNTAPDGDLLRAREWVASPETVEHFRAALDEATLEMERAATRDEALLSRERLVSVAYLAGFSVDA
jgi:transcriptional regulator with XRE-family HTH domain